MRKEGAACCVGSYTTGEKQKKVEEEGRSKIQTCRFDWYTPHVTQFF